MKNLFKNNKGFTLVELIIVIAIIGIITVVVAPQYLGYVEKSKEAMDRNAMGEIAHAAEVAMVEASADGKVSDDVEVTVNDKGTVTAGDLQTYLEKVIPNNSYTFKSKKFLNSDRKITVYYTTGKATWTDPTATTN